jgi:import inner membrane translocase subunit TIM13
MQSVQALIDGLSAKCFTACVSSPSTSLSKSEKVCIERCTEKYLDCHNKVFVTLGEFANSQGAQQSM